MRSPIARTCCCRSAVSTPCFAQLADLLAGRVSLSLQLFAFGERCAALAIQFLKRRDVQLEAARRQPL